MTNLTQWDQGSGLEIWQQLSQWSLQLELLYTVFMYTPYVLRTRRYFASSKPAQIANLPYIPLLVHLISGVIDLTRYYLKAFNIIGSTPDALDLALCFAHAISSCQMARRVTKGNTYIPRNCFQATGIQRALATSIAYCTGEWSWYFASIKLHNNFIWVRWLIPAIRNLGVTGSKEYGPIYMAGVFIACPICLWEGGYPLGISMFCVLMAVLPLLEQWAARQYTQPR